MRSDVGTVDTNLLMALYTGLAHGLFVFFKAFQQRNVMGMHYKWTLGTSYFMSSTEVFVVSLVAVNAVEAAKTGDVMLMVPFVVSMGTFSGIGAIAGMWAHVRFVKNV